MQGYIQTIDIKLVGQKDVILQSKYYIISPIIPFS